MHKPTRAVFVAIIVVSAWLFVRAGTPSTGQSEGGSHSSDQSPQIYKITSPEGTPIVVDATRVSEGYANAWQWQVAPRGEIIIDFGTIMIDPSQRQSGTKQLLWTISHRIDMSPQVAKTFLADVSKGLERVQAEKHVPTGDAP